MNGRDYAVQILQHYFNLLAKRTGTSLDCDCMSEIEGAVDCIIEVAKKEIKVQKLRLFPIMSEYGRTKTIEYIPYAVIASHEKQALHNHGQTLNRLAERGGLSYCEALAILEDRKWKSMEQSIAKQRVIGIVSTFELPMIYEEDIVLVNDYVAGSPYYD